MVAKEAIPYVSTGVCTIKYHIIAFIVTCVCVSVSNMFLRIVFLCAIVHKKFVMGKIFDR